MLNMCIMTGHLTKDIELKEVDTKKGETKKVVNGTIAVNDGVSQYPDYINFATWEKNATIINDYTTKGSLVTLTGKWKKRKITDQNGNVSYFDYLLVENINLLEDKAKTDERKAKNDYVENPFDNTDKISIYDM
ncbi:single-stranded DNA-binding protein [Staphylococcus gallinarum]|uniref:single-stranded DNA-binding protein n=1 Tax=Staphylococcus TaxID=1279 RepID=UPI000E679A6B|nr:single-stranded DNA-binding protein [Staphylococcus gallinarum]RIL23366.1 single-stranded DNA-binding protein [Staphylococcus gallinarum]